MTFLRDAGQAPFYYNHNNTGRPCNGTETLLEDIPLHAGQTSLGCTSYYLDTGYGPLFPFGYGLSYTTFAYDNIVLNKTTFGTADTIVVAFDLTNTGSRPGVEVAQLYTRDLVGSTVRPIKELKRFERVALQPGETKHLRFELPVAELAFWNRDMEYTVEPGDFRLWVAGDSESGTAHPFSVE
ncbi:MAG: fibronectin type III-like domain-contianing protein [Alistipes sp.]|nr:fibronectin type III-like domain-contianing protein [Alistipes sp.]